MVENLTEVGGHFKAHTDSTFVGVFGAHTDPTDLTDFVFEGGKSHRGWGVIEVSECSDYQGSHKFTEGILNLC